MLDALSAAIHGRVLGRGAEEFDRARAVIFGGIDHRPAAIARVQDADDIAAVIRIARQRWLPLSVRSGGHGATGAAGVDDGIVSDVRDLTSIELDLEGLTAWAGSGLTAVDFSKAIIEHRLAVGFGDTGSVGLGGITLGGGIGYLVRKFGLTIDALLGAEIVTADGELREVDAAHEPDLFWAIRGGGGNFGGATRFRFQLHGVPAFSGGLLVLPATPETVALFIAESQDAPEELSTIANVMPCPPLPFVAEAHHGKVVIFALMACAAADDEAARMLAPFRAIAEPLGDMVQPIPYPDIYPPEDDSYHPLAVSRNLFMDRFDLPTAKRIVETLEASDASMRVAQIRVLGGAASRVANDATAYAHRDRPIMVNVAAFYEGEHDRAQRTAWVEDFAAWLSGGDPAAYVNFLADEGEPRIRASYPHGAYERLAAIKRRYDPANIFSNCQNVLPTTV